MSYTLEITLVLVVVASACALPGVFLVLRRMSLVSDAISHVLLFGIVLAYFLTRDIDSPLLMIGAAATGVLTVALVELLQRTKLVKEDAAVGLVFPALFALGVLLASMFLRNTHLDIDAVLVGDPNLITSARWTVAGVGIRPLWIMSGILAANVLLVILFFKELKLTTFDPGLAASLGFRPGLMHYALMAVVSLTAVAAFDAVGPVLVVGFFVVPAATALLLTDRLAVMLGLSVLIGSAAGGVGTLAAFGWDITVAGRRSTVEGLNTNVAGTVAVFLGILFALVFAFAPSRGLLAEAVRRWKQKREFHETMLAIHLLHHEGTPEEADEARCDGLHKHFSWTATWVAGVVRRLERRGLVRREGELLKLTEDGRERARTMLNL